MLPKEAKEGGKELGKTNDIVHNESLWRKTDDNVVDTGANA